MKFGIYGRKVGMTQVFDEAGTAIPVTVIDAKDCFIAQVKTKQVDGYNALQLAYGECKPQNVSKPRVGHFKKAGIQAKSKLQELRLDDADDMTQFKPGQILNPGMFLKGDVVDVIGISKGLGMTGVMKRYNWHGADATHGVSKYFRHGGSNGSNTFPGRVLKNKGAPGHVGNAPVTMIGLKVVEVDGDANLILVRGAVPGPNTGPVFLRPTNRKPLPTERTFVRA